MVLLINVAATVFSLRHRRRVQRLTGKLVDPFERLLSRWLTSRQRYTRADISPYHRVNGYPPPDPAYQRLADHDFAGYRLEVGGLVERPAVALARATCARSAATSQITKHNCIQGWTNIAEWGGVPLAAILDQCRPDAAGALPRLLRLRRQGDHRERGPLRALLRHHPARSSPAGPQTILALDMNGAPLPVEHGAPVRLRVETQLGFKMVKWIRSIELVADYARIGMGQGGWREDQQYYANAGRHLTHTEPSMPSHPNTTGRRRHRRLRRHRARDRARLRQTRRARRAARPRPSRARRRRRRRSARSAARRSPCPTDVADADQVEAAAAAVEQHFGPIDVWVNDAMATVFARFIDTQPDEFKRATEVTYLGAVYGTMAALKRMTRARPRHDRAGRLRAVLPRDPAAGRLLRREVRDPRLHRLDPHRAARRPSNVRITMVQLPGVNTTQFNWCRSKLPNHPQPVPPIYQPEIPAEAVYWAAQHRRRELWVGYSAVQAILGNKLAPWLADRYLARTAISGQQVDDMPVAADRPDNLFEPVAGKAATHGIFDAQAKTRSPQLWAATHRPARRRRAGRRRARRRSACCERCDERRATASRHRRRRTCCANTRCWPTASAASSSARAATSPGCASRAGTRTPSSPR